MDFIENVKILGEQEEVKKEVENFTEDLIGAVLGDRVSAVKVGKFLVKFPSFIREQLFWGKMERFLNGVYLDENDKDKLCTKLEKDGKKRDNALRLIECIDRVQTQQKIQYLINATRCLINGDIDRETFFRICNLITCTLEEDLDFLSKNVDKVDLSYGMAVQGLLTSGLMYQSAVGEEGSKYSFTPIAKVVDRYALTYENVLKYPTGIRENLDTIVPVTKLNVQTEEISRETIEELLKNS